jgi:O-antigen ligase
VYVIAAAGLITLGAFATLTRSIWICLPVIYFVFAWIPASIRCRGVMTMAATAGLALALCFFGHKLNSFQRDKHVPVAQMSESASLRPMLAYVAWQMFEDRPLLGCGFGHYTRVKRVYHLDRHSGMPLQKVLGYMQHNIVLSYLTELGLIGVLLFAWIVVAASWAASRLISIRPDPPDDFNRQSRRHSDCGWLLLAMVACWLINGMFHDVSIIPMIGSFMYFLFGLTNDSYRQAFGPAPAATRSTVPQPKPVATTVAIG